MGVCLRFTSHRHPDSLHLPQRTSTSIVAKRLFSLRGISLAEREEDNQQHYHTTSTIRSTTIKEGTKERKGGQRRTTTRPKLVTILSWKDITCLLSSLLYTYSSLVLGVYYVFFSCLGGVALTLHHRYIHGRSGGGSHLSLGLPSPSFGRLPHAEPNVVCFEAGLQEGARVCRTLPH